MEEDDEVLGKDRGRECILTCNVTIKHLSYTEMILLTSQVFLLRSDDGAAMPTRRFQRGDRPLCTDYTTRLMFDA